MIEGVYSEFVKLESFVIGRDICVMGDIKLIPERVLLNFVSFEIIRNYLERINQIKPI